MREALGGISLFQIVIVFVLLFTGIMCLTINHSKAFGVKDEIITIIQNENVDITGSNFELSVNTIDKISKHLQEAGYRITGDCPNNNWVGYDRDGNIVTNNASFCIKANSVSESYQKDLEEKCKGGKCIIIGGVYPKMVYYDVILFYQLDIPVLNEIMQFELKGSTKILFGE